MNLEDFKTNDPALAADARLSSNLLMAGLLHRQCKGVLAATEDEAANLAVAINVRLLNPAVPVLARVRTPVVAANMASFGTISSMAMNALQNIWRWLHLCLTGSA